VPERGCRFLTSMSWSCRRQMCCVFLPSGPGAYQRQTIG
jgi:hypothetical protein